MTERDDSAEIVDRIYDVAVDPIRYEAMMDAWDRRLSAHRLSLPPGQVSIELDSFIQSHLERADIFLERLDLSEPDAATSRAPVDYKPTFVTDDASTARQANESAFASLGIRTGDRLQKLPLQEHDVELLRRGVRALLAAPSDAARLMRFTSTATGRSIVFHLAAQKSADGAPGVHVRTTELGWPPHLSQALRDAFTLTQAEVEVVQGLVEGNSVKEIAAMRKRSFATIRSQLAATLAKTETRSQTELVRLTLGLMDVVGSTAPEKDGLRSDGSIRPIPFQSLTRPDGRRYDFIEFGAPQGWACLFLPLDYGMIRWPRAAEIAAREMGMRVIAPVRAGYGQSSPLPANADYTLETARDLLGLLDHLRIQRCAVIALGADLRYAMRLGTLAPDRVATILGCSTALPVMTASQYERMHKWHRFILANARYAPQILPFITKAGFAFARRIGKERFFRSVNAGSPADMRTFSIPEIRDAILEGSEICLSRTHSAHDAFAREVIDGERNWAHLVRECRVPVRLLQGAEDPQTPAETVRELAVEFPHLDIEIVDDAGQLLFFQHWPRVLREVEALYHGRPAPRSAAI